MHIGRPTQTVPSGLRPLADWFEAESVPERRERFRWALRDALDQLLDGQRSGRWAYQQLAKTEKTHLGTLVELQLTRELDIASGERLDWSIAGFELDCKFSKDLGGWEIPMEMYVCQDHGEQSGTADSPALIVWMDDDVSEWAAGLIVATDERLRWKVQRGNAPRARAYNRDNKRRLADAARSDIYWLWGGVQNDLPPNRLLHLDAHLRDRILGHGRSGQKRVNELFRQVQGEIVDRQTVLTVGQQDDAPKRARDARHQLRAEGIVVLGHQGAHRQAAERLQLPIPAKGQWISVRLTQVSTTAQRPKFQRNGAYWAVARADEPGLAPDLPSNGSLL